MEWRIQNSNKHLRWIFLRKKSTDFAKISTLDVWLGFECIYVSTCDALRDFVPFVQLKKKHPWGSATLSKVAG